MPAQAAATAAAAAPVASATTSSQVPPPDTATKSASSSSSETNNNASTRLSNTTASLPIVIGSIAFYLGKKADEFQSHEWTLYVRGPNHEDLSVCISKVIFQLHASFAQPIRELTQPPFEVTERGWGEFEAQIRIFWKDPNEKPTVFNHGIPLYPPGSAPGTLPTNEGKPVVAEKYDEVVFTDPDEAFYRQLSQISVVPKVEASHQEHLTKTFSDQDDFLALIEAQKFLKDELSNVKERFKLVSDELQSVDHSLIIAQQQQREASTKKTKAGSRKPRPPSQTKKAKT